MKTMKMKTILLLALVAALLLGTVGGTVAYLVTSTGPVTNTFTPGTVDTGIVETFENNVKSSIKVSAVNSTVDVWVRVAIVGNWVDASGNVVAPWTGSINHNTANWTKGNDGYYYYTTVVKAGEATLELLNNYITYESKDVPVAGARLEVTVIQQSIQAEGLGEGVDTAQEAFAKANAQ